jgi:hypothetical protein
MDRHHITAYYVCTLLFMLACLALCAYVVFWRGQSGWWFAGLLAAWEAWPDYENDGRTK